MKTKLFSVAIVFCFTGFASCAQPEKAPSAPRVAPVGSRFEGIGKVVLHRGQPCTSQIMFDFHGAKSAAVVWLAVNAHEERLLIEAANKRRVVHLSGKWQHGRTKDCAYVTVGAVEVQKPKFFWQR